MRSRVLALAALAALMTFSGLKADEKEGWTSLFNGKDLTGWKISEKADWKVDDEGCIVTPPQRSHLFTEKEYKNFEFKAQVMTRPGSNSGIYFHTKYEENFPKAGIECQVNCTHTDPVRNGSLYFIVKNYDPIAKDNEWYDYKIIVNGKNVKTFINDKLVVDYTEPEGVTGDRKISSGSFALQGHDPKSVVRYRNLMVKELP